MCPCYLCLSCHVLVVHFLSGLFPPPLVSSLFSTLFSLPATPSQVTKNLPARLLSIVWCVRGSPGAALENQQHQTNPHTVSLDHCSTPAASPASPG
ncbi:mCG147768 [Mus musculus]|nr:mCG147768 [Mus musculus]